MTLYELLDKHLSSAEMSLIAEDVRDVDCLLTLSHNEKAVVREGAIYGMSAVLTQIVTRLIELQKDESRGVAAAAVEAMERDWR